MEKPDRGDVRASHVRAGIAGLFLAVLSLMAMLGPGVSAQAPASGPPERAFEGSWSATGTRQVLAMGEGRKAAIIYLSGTLILNSPEGLSLGFRCEAVGFDDGRGLSVGDAVWTDDRGDQIFSEVKGEAVSTGKHVVGTIIGGTGRYAGIAGEYEFDWQYVIQAPEGVIQGRAVHLKGRYHGTAPPVASPPPQDAPK